MPPLTWRDTVGPDFSTTLGAIRQTGASLNQGLSGASDALGKFNDYSQGQNASALMANAVKYTNPADLQKAFADGSIYNGVNQGYLTADALKATQGQIGTLLHDATAAENLDFNKQADPLRVINYGNQNTRVQQEIDQSSRMNPLLVDQQKAVTASQLIANTQSQSMNPLLLDQQKATTASQLIANTQATNMNPLLLDQQGQLNTGRDISNQGAALGLSEAQRTTSDRLSAQPLINQLANAKDSDGVNAVLSSPEAMALSPGARQLLNQSAQAGSSPGAPALAGTTAPGGGSRALAAAVGSPQATSSSSSVYDPTPGAPGSIARTVAAAPSVAGTAGTTKGSMYDMTLGGIATPTPVSTSKIGDVVEYGRNKMIPTQGGSPTGAYQITADTLDDFGPKVLGADWKSKTYSPENQDKIAEAIFNANKNGNLKARWASLPNATPGAYKDKTWAEMRGIITKGEVGNVDPSGSPNGLGDVNSLLQDAKRRDTDIGVKLAMTSHGLDVGSAQNLAGSPESGIYQPRMIQDKDAKGAVIGQHMGPAPIDDNTPEGEVLNRLTSSSVFQGVAPETLLTTLHKTMKTAGVNAASAAFIMESHPQGAGWLRRNLPYILGGYNFQSDDKATELGAQSVMKGTADDTAIQSQVSGAVSAKIAAAATEAQNASKAYAAALRDPNMASQVDGLRAKRDATEQLFHAVNDPVYANDSMNQIKREADGTLIPRHAAPVAPAPVPESGSAGSAIAATVAGPSVPAAIPGADIQDQGIQIQRSKVQDALDRLSAASSRLAPNDPKLGAFKVAKNKAELALQVALASRPIPTRGFDGGL